jgi:GST-like protein
MLKFHYNTGPNPMKVALFLEDAGLEYEAIPVDGRTGDQHKPEYKAINPNSKAPTLVDGDTVVFDSNAILLYLARKSGKFMPSAAHEGDMLSWLMFIATGVGPYSGQSVHFRHHAPEQLPYAVQRYMFEARRHYSILNDRLADQQYLVGGKYSFVDMAAWGWARLIPVVLGAEVLDELPNLKRLVDEITARPAAERAMAIKDRYTFKTEMDEDARRNMFPAAYQK